MKTSGRHAFRVRLRPGAGVRYDQLHSPMPEAIRAQLAAAGIQRYSIFRDGDDVFGVFDYQDASLLRSTLGDDVAPEWTRDVAGLMIDREIDPATGALRAVPTVFEFVADAR